ncbi:hypothetical protein MTO96_035156 [Rhipicephalus appendiculatus]
MLYSAKCDDSWRHVAAVSLMSGSAEQMTETRGELPVNLSAIALSRTNFGQMARLALRWHNNHGRNENSPRL